MTTIKLRRGTAAEWTSANPVLSQGEPGYETDTGKYKLGDGFTAWDSLPYFLNETDLSNMFTPKSSSYMQAVIVSSGSETRPTNCDVVLWVSPNGVTPTNATATDLISTGGNITGGAASPSHLALDTDGVPYYDSAGGSSDIFVKTDTDGVRYFASSGPSDSHLAADTDGVPYYVIGA